MRKYAFYAVLNEMSARKSDTVCDLKRSLRIISVVGALELELESGYLTTLYSCDGIRNVRSVLTTIRSLEHSFPWWNFRSRDHSFPGTFVLKNIRSLEHSFPGPFIPETNKHCRPFPPRTIVPWTVPSLELSFQVPWTFPAANHSFICQQSSSGGSREGGGGVRPHPPIALCNFLVAGLFCV